MARGRTVRLTVAAGDDALPRRAHALNCSLLRSRTASTRGERGGGVSSWRSDCRCDRWEREEPQTATRDQHYTVSFYSLCEKKAAVPLTSARGSSESGLRDHAYFLTPGFHHSPVYTSCAAKTSAASFGGRICRPITSQ